MNNFLFFETRSDIKIEGKGRSVIIPSNINEKLDLFDSYNKQLNFPSYFGYNWDALYDCMVDLSWINEHTIQIIHNDIPFKSNQDKRTIYLKLLIDICSSWEKSYSHKILIFFPQSCLTKMYLSLN